MADDAKEKLREYRAKRRFNVTPEPAGDAPSAAAQPDWAFVVQKHAASRLHYDFRLELDGVLLSWAVPKGPCLAPGTRRLAARTEDHPIEYASFEGIIPEDEYGGGTVVVWDRGTWQPDGDPRAAMKKGRLTFELFGEKLKGRWHLVRTRAEGGKEQWLLFKGRDEHADDSADICAERPESVVTGRTVEQVAEAKDKVWHSNRVEKKGPGKAIRKWKDEKVDKAVTAPDAILEMVRQLPQSIPFTNLEKILYPEQGITKGALIAYLAVVADWMLPQLAGRPLTLVRCPDGHHRHCFFQKHAKEGTPPAIRRIEIAEETGVPADYMAIDDLAGLLALAQMGVLEIHTWGCHADQVERPDQIVFDLDPDTGLGWQDVVRTALELRDRLADLGLTSFVKTTGGKGLHVVAPIVRRTGWDEFKAFTKAVAEAMEAEHPDRFTTNPLKVKRRGKIFVDYLRNAHGASAIVAYSPRKREGATVAAPLTWGELEKGVIPESLNIVTVPKRLGSLRADPWAGYHDLDQSITAAARRKVGMKR